MAMAVPAIMIGLSAAQTAQSVSAASKQRKLSRAKTGLDLAQVERENQEQLAQGLARQAVVGGAAGVAPSSGSLMRQALSARRAAERGILSARGRAELEDAGSRLDYNNRVVGSLINFGESAVRQIGTMAK
ncbi:MAG: hypothetical protein VYB54_09585 [Pseudomonadota bacterium]|nr:hypothetical protein [Pseudomonadota bacterium]